MPSSGCITIWASDFDAGSYDNCTRQSNLHLTIEGEDSLTICCQDFIDKKADDELVIPIKMCVEDEEGNKDCCTTTLVVQDPQGCMSKWRLIERQDYGRDQNRDRQSDHIS
jgi:hypothetical protein